MASSLIDSLLRELGVTDRDKALTRISNIVGHPIASRTELTVAEAERVIDVLNAVPRQARP